MTEATGSITALDAIKAARASRERLLGNGPVEVTFEAWTMPNGRPFVCHVWPMTGEEHDRILAARERGKRAGRAGTYDLMVETILVRARNADRTRIFQDPQRDELLALHAEDLRELADRISAAEPTPEEVAGNSTTRSSESAPE